jgi:MSHA biogenesis protein MshK
VAGRLSFRASILLAAGFMAVAWTSAAQSLRDPTRPPFMSAKGAGGKTERPGWILQSVLISPERRYAIINGEVIQLGGSIAGAELVAVAEGRVTLRTPDGLRIVHLFPDVARLASDADTGTGRAAAAADAKKKYKC